MRFERVFMQLMCREGVPSPTNDDSANKLLKAKCVL